MCFVEKCQATKEISKAPKDGCPYQELEHIEAVINDPVILHL
jgi:hypothetical protein